MGAFRGVVGSYPYPAKNALLLFKAKNVEKYDQIPGTSSTCKA